MRRKHKALAILIGSSLFTSAARFSYSYLRFHAVGSRFHHIKVGETRQQVRKTLGKPNHHDGPCNSDITTPVKGCEWEYVYSFPLAPLIPEYYVVAFSKDDRVLEAAHLTSP
jgi:outer membrane protein assembly factor BamE (lipoprotein component of BamABCDE complex)